LIIESVVAATVAVASSLIRRRSDPAKVPVTEIDRLDAEIRKYRAIQNSMDIRTTVFVVVIGAALYGLLKDGGGLISRPFMIAHMWTCVAGLVFGGISLFAFTGGLDYENDDAGTLAWTRRERNRMRRITKRKTRSNNATLGAMIMAAGIVALDYTLA
jgi:hypothetical protein